MTNDFAVRNRRLSKGGSRHSAKPVRRHSADDRRTAAAAGRIDSLRRSRVMNSGQTTGEARLDQGKYRFRRRFRASRLSAASSDGSAQEGELVGSSKLGKDQVGPQPSGGSRLMLIWK